MSCRCDIVYAAVVTCTWAASIFTPRYGDYSTLHIKRVINNAQIWNKWKTLTKVQEGNTLPIQVKEWMNCTLTHSTGKYLYLLNSVSSTFDVGLLVIFIRNRAWKEVNLKERLWCCNTPVHPLYHIISFQKWQHASDETITGWHLEASLTP